jgi:hypothetical protein
MTSSIGQRYKDAGLGVLSIPANVLGTGVNVVDSAGNMVSTSGKIGEDILNTTRDVFNDTSKIARTGLGVTNDLVSSTGKLGVTGVDVTNDLVSATGKLGVTGLGVTNDLVSSTGKLGVTGLDATNKGVEGIGNVAKTGLDVTNDLVSSTGKIGVSAVNTVGNTLKTVENLSERLENYAEASKDQADIENKTATIKVQNANDVKRREIETKRETKIQIIDNNLEIATKKTEADQKRILNELTANQKLQYLKSDDNIRKQNLARYYGFTNDNPSSNDIGFTTKFFGLSDYCSSYIPQKFVTADKNVIGIIFPEEIPEGPRPHYISAINKKTGEPIQITFETIIESKFYDSKKEKEISVIKYKDEQNNDVEKQGEIKYHKIVFLCLNKVGGKRRRTNKRRNKKTNKRRKSIRRFNKKQKTNKRRRTDTRN